MNGGTDRNYIAYDTNIASRVLIKYYYMNETTTDNTLKIPKHLTSKLIDLHDNRNIKSDTGCDPLGIMT